MNRIKNRIIIFLLLIVILILGIVQTAYAASELNDYSWSKQTADEWRKSSEAKNLGYGSNLWTINALDGLYDYSKDFWMPIQPWEYQVCSRGLTTQLHDANEVTANGGGIYTGVESITVAAYRRVPVGNDSFLYEVTWFIQPSGERGYMYSIDAKGHGQTKVIQAKKGAGQKTGDSGYLPFYSDVNYTQIVLTYLEKEHIYPILEVKDESRQ